jgi:hypothetical protein
MLPAKNEHDRRHIGNGHYPANGGYIFETEAWIPIERGKGLNTHAPAFALEAHAAASLEHVPQRHGQPDQWARVRV